MSQGEGYDADDRKQLLASIGELISGADSALARAGRTRPGRALIDAANASAVAAAARLSACARESLPDAPLPFTAAYPGGRSRVIAHIDAARTQPCATFRRAAGRHVAGRRRRLEDFVKHLAAAGCRWIASGEGVLNNSLAASGIDDPRAAYHPWRWSRRRG
jgi:hypothetical protein